MIPIEPCFMAILVVLGSYLLAIVAGNASTKRKDPLRGFNQKNIRKFFNL